MDTEAATDQWGGHQRPPENTQFHFITGLGLAILSSIFIGSSFIIKKLSLQRLSRKGAVRAGAGGFGYLKDWTWWLGIAIMGLGELFNFAAYTFAPASMVTPLGALSVLVSAILASKFLKEGLSALGKLGCLLCILGSVVIIIHSPKEQEVESIEELLDKLHNTIFLHYVIFVIVLSVIIIFYVGPRWGTRHVLVYIILCSAIGSFNVMAVKGLGLSINEAISNRNDISYWSAYTFFLIVVICVCIQMNYLNKALDLFNTNVVTPVYYVFFTSFVIVASTILFDEWRQMTLKDILGNLCGFLVVIVAICLLQTFRDKSDIDEGKRQWKGMTKTMGGKGEYGSSIFIPRKV